MPSLQALIDWPGLSRRVSLLTRARLLFGGPTNRLLWIWVLVSLGGSAAFLRSVDVKALFCANRPLDLVAGKAEQIQRSGWSRDGQSIYEVAYAFLPPGIDRRYNGVGYTTAYYNPGDTVAIEYDPDDPTVSRIRGGYQAPFGPGGLAVLLLPLGGLAALAFSVRRGLMMIRLLSHGQLGHGELIDSERTERRVDDEYVYSMTFAFVASNGIRYEFTTETHRHNVKREDHTWPVLYDPARPADSVLMATLPADLGVDASGEIVAGSLVGNVVSLLLPVATVLLMAFIAFDVITR